jgi:hypothetical protein
MQMPRLLSSCSVLRPPITLRLTSQIASTAGDATLQRLIDIASQHNSDAKDQSADNVAILI